MALPENDEISYLRFKRKNVNLAWDCKRAMVGMRIGESKEILFFANTENRRVAKNYAGNHRYGISNRHGIFYVEVEICLLDGRLVLTRKE